MKKIMKNIYYKSKEILDNCSKDNVSEYSAQCAYYTILSFIPFLIILLTIIQYTGITQQNLYGIISKILPENMKESPTHASGGNNIFTVSDLTYLRTNHLGNTCPAGKSDHNRQA